MALYGSTTNWESFRRLPIWVAWCSMMTNQPTSPPLPLVSLEELEVELPHLQSESRSALLSLQ
eukprot:12904887-Prorocentrum_lima.AAC.1